jgi:steroid delta-isomerase-like uncharacterized protein
MSTEENKATLRSKHIEELFNKGNLSVADEIISADYVYHSPLGIEFKGPEGVKQMVSTARNAFPDLHFIIDDMVAEGDKVAVRYTYTGTHKGEYMGIAPTGKKINLIMAVFYRFVDGKEVEALSYSDMLALYQQLGVSPPGQ